MSKHFCMCVGACMYNHLALLKGHATSAIVLDSSKAFDRFWHHGFLHKLNSGHIFGLLSFFLSNWQVWVVVDGLSYQEHPVNSGVPQGSIRAPILFGLYIKDLLDNVICNFDIRTDDTTLFSKCLRHQSSGND